MTTIHLGKKTVELNERTEKALARIAGGVDELVKRIQEADALIQNSKEHPDRAFSNVAHIIGYNILLDEVRHREEARMRYSGGKEAEMLQATAEQIHAVQQYFTDKAKELRVYDFAFQTSKARGKHK